MLDLIDLEQKMQALQVRKAEVLERHFAIGENFLIQLDSFLQKLKSKGNAVSTVNATAEADLAFLESQKNQHKNNLRQL